MNVMSISQNQDLIEISVKVEMGLIKKLIRRQNDGALHTALKTN